MGIKGCARRMIVLNGVGGSVFETAYFIVKAGADEISNSDMMREANRIIEEHCFSGRRKRTGKRTMLFVGICIGAAAVGLAWLLCWALM